MKKKIISLFMMVCVGLSSVLMATGCDLLSIFDKAEKAALEDYFNAAENSAKKDVYTISIEEPGYTSTLTKDQYGVHYLRDYGNGEYFVSYEKFLEDTGVTYLSYIGTKDENNLVNFIDYNGELTEEEFEEQYGTVSSIVPILDSEKSISGIFQKINKYDSVANGKTTHEINIEKNNNVLEIEYDDFIVKNSNNSITYSIDADVELTFKDNLVKKVVVEIEKIQVEKNDDIYTEKGEPVEEQFVYTIEYNFDKNLVGNARELYNFGQVVYDDMRSSEVTIKNSGTIDFVGFDDKEDYTYTKFFVRTEDARYYKSDINPALNNVINGVFKLNGEYKRIGCWAAIDVNACDIYDSSEETFNGEGYDISSQLGVIDYYFAGMITNALNIDVDSDMGIEISNIEYEESTKYDYGFIGSKDGNKVITLVFNDYFLEGNSIGTFKANGTIEFVYNDSHLKEINVNIKRKVVMENGNSYTETGKEINLSYKYELEYEFTTEAQNAFEGLKDLVTD